MAFKQHVHDCDDHEDCTVIVGIQDNVEVWRSHMHSAVPAEHRLNMDYPDALDHRAGGKPKTLRFAPVTDEVLPAVEEHWTGFDREQHIAAATERNLS